MRRRHQRDRRNLIAVFDKCHQRRLPAKLLAPSKAIEKTQDQAMLSLAPQEKGLNAFEKLFGV
jgi:hypothetical protein